MNTKRNYNCPALISKQVESGDGVAQFCRDNNLNSKCFYNNRAKISATQTTSALIKVETQVPLPHAVAKFNGWKPLAHSITIMTI
ncbi:MAG: hypothetical protein HRU24_07285 [Gammaproteobacteria bacterium]|nr:hypothetical protein [Gammaproteobacteria bacterium]